MMNGFAKFLNLLEDLNAWPFSIKLQTASSRSW